MEENNVSSTLAERGARYGTFVDNAQLAQSLKNTLRSNTRWYKLPDAHREALDMIMHKAARIVNGDPNYADNWHDVAGYAILVEKECTKDNT